MAHTNGKVMLQFGANWCGPCKTIQPIAKEIALKADLTYMMIDVDHNPDLTNRLNVKGVPSFLLFKDGQELGRVQSSSPREIRELVKNCFNH